jgi:hypothetical protein
MARLTEIHHQHPCVILFSPSHSLSVPNLLSLFRGRAGLVDGGGSEVEQRPVDDAGGGRAEAGVVIEQGWSTAPDLARWEANLPLLAGVAARADPSSGDARGGQTSSPAPLPTREAPSLPFSSSALRPRWGSGGGGTGASLLCSLRRRGARMWRPLLCMEEQE